MSDYMDYRGKCKEMSEEAIRQDPSLTLVRGHYLCPIWGMQQHWWAKAKDGTIVDPTIKQFPTKGVGAEYLEFDGTIECERCHNRVDEADAYMSGHHAYCSYDCFGADVM